MKQEKHKEDNSVMCNRKRAAGHTGGASTQFLTGGTRGAPCMGTSSNPSLVYLLSLVRGSLQHKGDFQQSVVIFKLIQNLQ